MVRASDKNDTENVKKALMIINPDAYYLGLINDEDALKEIFKRSNIRMAGNVCNQMKKEALFRPKPWESSHYGKIKCRNISSFKCSNVAFIQHLQFLH